jgi:galactokinase/mevalonate kinase-like predicted kinase
MRFKMGIIKGVLKEELSNSIKMKKNYEKAIKKHPGGCFVKKSIRGYSYYYLAVREGKKVRFIYKGKEVSSADKNALKKSKLLRAKYKKLIQKLNKQIKYLRVALRGKEDV